MDIPIKTMRVKTADSKDVFTINIDDFDATVHKPADKVEATKVTGQTERVAATLVAGAAPVNSPNPPTPEDDLSRYPPANTPPKADTGFNVGGALIHGEDGDRKPANLAEAEALKRQQAGKPIAGDDEKLAGKSAPGAPPAVDEAAGIVDLVATDATAWVEKQTDKPTLKRALAAEQKHQRYDGGRKAVVEALTAKIDTL